MIVEVVVTFMIVLFWSCTVHDCLVMFLLSNLGHYFKTPAKIILLLSNDSTFYYITQSSLVYFGSATLLNQLRVMFCRCFF